MLPDADSYADTYVGDAAVLRVDVGLDLLSVDLSDFTEVGNYVMPEEERSIVGWSVLNIQL